MKTTLIAALLVLAAPAAALASGPARAAAKKAQQSPPPATEAPPALSDEELKQQIGSFLGSIDTPIPAESWKGLGPRGAALLEGVARDGQELPTRRARAVDGMTAMRWTAGEPLFRELAQAEAEPLNLRFAAVRALGALLPKARAERELSALLAGAKDARVRAIAGEALARRAGKAGCAAVKRQLAREEEAERGVYVRAVEACEAKK